MTRFLKMHGLGNDFVILDQKDLAGMLTNEQIRHICDRHTGVGCDQLVLLEASQKADVFARFFNADGSEAEACGNATRCVADLVMKEIKQESCNIETVAGILPCRAAEGGLVEVDMGPPKGVEDLDIGEGDIKNPVSVNMGNPHCVFFVSDAGDIPVDKYGKTFETHDKFPDRTNVEFAQVSGDNAIRLRVWERGAGVTLACGSGACATIVAAVHRGLTGRKVDIEMDGGTLHLEQRESDGHVLMTGPVSYVFEGQLNA